jgi:hypothetical protein
MAESIKWFEKSGITPDVVLKAWFDHVLNNKDVDPTIINEALLLYAKIHPDMAIKGLEQVKVNSMPQVYLGEQQHFQQLQAPVTTPTIMPVSDNGHSEEVNAECVNVEEQSTTDS